MIVRSLAAALLLLWTTASDAQVDPGIPGLFPRAGQPFSSGLSADDDLAFFNNFAVPQFTQVVTVADGLGPRFNFDSCAGCHAFPSVGGSSPPRNNPQFVRGPVMAPGSTVPSFIKMDGPIRVVRFVRASMPDPAKGRDLEKRGKGNVPQRSNGKPDGAVHSIFTVVGRSDNPPGCKISQPDFSDASNMRFRIPTPVFGLGLIESITDTAIKSNLAADPAGLKRALGIRSEEHTSELQSPCNLVCRLLLEKKKKQIENKAIHP